MSRPVHFEIFADDTQRAANFFSSVFGWQINSWGEGDAYLMCSTSASEGDMGIDGAIAKRDENYAQPVINAINVDSVDEYCEKIVAAGGTITVPKMAVPTMGWVAYFTDTEGNTHGLWQTDPNAA
jgi:predicted enzyme related to lactoylglutathione lyase